MRLEVLPMECVLGIAVVVLMLAIVERR